MAQVPPSLLAAPVIYTANWAIHAESPMAKYIQKSLQYWHGYRQKLLAVGYPRQEVDRCFCFCLPPVLECHAGECGDEDGVAQATKPK